MRPTLVALAMLAPLTFLQTAEAAQTRALPKCLRRESYDQRRADKYVGRVTRLMEKRLGEARGRAENHVPFEVGSWEQRALSPFNKALKAYAGARESLEYANRALKKHTAGDSSDMEAIAQQIGMPLADAVAMAERGDFQRTHDKLKSELEQAGRNAVSGLAPLPIEKLGLTRDSTVQEIHAALVRNEDIPVTNLRALEEVRAIGAQLAEARRARRELEDEPAAAAQRAEALERELPSLEAQEKDLERQLEAHSKAGVEAIMRLANPVESNQIATGRRPAPEDYKRRQLLNIGDVTSMIGSHAQAGLVQLELDVVQADLAVLHMSIAAEEALAEAATK